MLSLTHQNPIDFSIGSVVTFCTHPFFNESDKEHILIGGDPSTLPPLMVIVETLKESKSVFDENSGMEIVNKGSFQCKVQWYSSDSCSFEESWVSSRLLKPVKLSEENKQIQEIKYGSVVVFKTAHIEIAKKKTSLKQIGTHADQRNKSITGVLSFTSPVMQVIGIVQNDLKASYDQRTGDLKKELAKTLIKCKYYNSKSNKFSEVLIAKEALSEVQQTPAEILNVLNRVIQNGGYLKTESPNKNFKQTIIKPLTIIYKLGSYFLVSFDYIENKEVEIKIGNSLDQFGNLSKDFIHLPTFTLKSEKLESTMIGKHSLSALKQNVFWRIRYKDRNDNITTRTIYNPAYFQGEEIIDNELKVTSEDERKSNQGDYLKANCILRNHQERYFRIDRIQRVQVLDIDAIQNLEFKTLEAGAERLAQAQD